jgi:hypothetical protein
MTEQPSQTTVQDGTAKDFVDHWDWVTTKGLLNANTARTYKAAAARVLQIEGQGWESLDVRSLDVESLLGRFENLVKKDFTPASLAAYSSRFQAALRLYLSYLDDPRSYRPQSRDRAAQVDRGRRAAGKGTSAPGQSTTGKADVGGAQHVLVGDHARGLDQPTSKMVRYPFPIRSGIIAELVLPIDLRRSEAKRLQAFLDSIAMEADHTADGGSPEEEG